MAAAIVLEATQKPRGGRRFPTFALVYCRRKPERLQCDLARKTILSNSEEQRFAVFLLTYGNLPLRQYVGIK